MSNTQLFLGIVALVLAQSGALATAFKLYLDAKIDGVNTKTDSVNTTVDIKIDALKSYIDAKIDPVKSQVDLLVQYMIDHQGRIATLEERTKHLSGGK